MSKVHIEDSNALDDFQACIENMQVMDISSHEGLSAKDKDVHQSLAILRKMAVMYGKDGLALRTLGTFQIFWQMMPSRNWRRIY